MSTTITIRDDTGKIILGKNIFVRIPPFRAIVPEPSLTDRVKNWNATNPVSKCSEYGTPSAENFTTSPKNKLRTNI